MKKRHYNIPVFVPHLGCPNDCIFCNQKKITGCDKYDFDDTKRQISDQLSTIDYKNNDVQIAFFGGSFTGIERNSMISMLELANQFIKNGFVKSIRLSTRPDYINIEILSILKEYNVTDIELGIQSMNDSVLIAAERGHTANNSINAAKLIRDFNINFIGQMMVGLPGSDIDKEIYTARKICEMGACGVRIYPTLVFENTKLETLYKQKIYVPLTVNEAADRCSRLIKIFEQNGVPIIRLGLCETDNLRTEGSVVAGPYHPSIGEICENKYYLNEIEMQIPNTFSSTKDQNIEIFVSKGSISKAVGQNRSNRIYLTNKYSFASIKFTEDISLHSRKIKIAQF